MGFQLCICFSLFVLGYSRHCIVSDFECRRLWFALIVREDCKRDRTLDNIHIELVLLRLSMPYKLTRHPGSLPKEIAVIRWCLVPLGLGSTNSNQEPHMQRPRKPALPVRCISESNLEPGRRVLWYPKREPQRREVGRVGVAVGCNCPPEIWPGFRSGYR